MGRKRYTPERIISKLRQAEVQLSQGSTIGETSRQMGISELTYYRLGKEYGGMRVDQARRLKEVEKVWADLFLWATRSSGRQCGETSEPGQEELGSALYL